MQRATEQRGRSVSELTGCSLCTAKMKSLEHTIAVLRREVEYSRTVSQWYNMFCCVLDH